MALSSTSSVVKRFWVLSLRNTSTASIAMKKLSVSLMDSLELRVILSVLYIMTEVLREHEDDNIRESFASELSNPYINLTFYHT